MEAVGIKVVQRAGAAAQHAELRRGRPRRGQQQGRLPLLSSAAGNLNASMARSMYDTGYKLKFARVPHRLRLELHRAGRRRPPRASISWIRAAAQRGGGGNPEQTALPRVDGRGSRPGVPPDTFAADAWAAAKAFFDALEALPGPDLPRRAPRPAAVGRHLRRRRLLRPDPARQEAEQRLLHRHAGRQDGEVEAPHARPRVPLLTDCRRAAAIAPRRSRCTTCAPATAASRCCTASTSPSARGGVTALLGPNGAGKTTALGVMSGLLDAHPRLPPRRGPAPQRRRRRRARPHRRLPHPRGPVGVPEPQRGRQPHRRRRPAARRSSACTEVAFTLFPRLRGAAASSWPARCRAARSRCSPWPAGLGTDPSVLLVDELSMGLAPMVVGELYEAVAAGRRDRRVGARRRAVRHRRAALRRPRLRDGPRRRHLRRPERRARSTPSTRAYLGAAR